MSDSHKLLDYWQAPDGAGRPIACLATSFTFEPDFFEEDCLSRFLGLDSVRGESDSLAYLIEEEERLAEVAAAALVDRSQNPGNRNLRWDILTVAVPGGLMHAKVSLLVWEHLVRVIIGSANLTRAGYRSQLEVAVALDGFAGSQIPAPLFEEAWALLRDLTGRASGSAEEPGPKQRALETISQAQARVANFGLPPRGLRGAPRLALVFVEPGRSALDGLHALWPGSPPRRAIVVSPFFDTGEGETRSAAALASKLARTGRRHVRFILPADHLPARTVVRAPKALTAALPPSIERSFEAVVVDAKAEPRRLHAKSILFEGERWVGLLAGSSNFTAAGLGLAARGHLEANIAIVARAGSQAAKALSVLAPETVPFDAEEVDWEPQEDEDESLGVTLPLGFVECLVEPSQRPVLVLRLEPTQLPASWQVELPATGEVVLTSGAWGADGSHPERRLRLPAGQLPFWVQVRWGDGVDERVAGLPVNVTDRTKLPPPTEMRSLPVDLLLRVLGSSRPLHEVLAEEIHRGGGKASRTLPPELDPLRRYSNAGRLLQRAKEASAALVGLQERLGRPVANLDALDWRLNGPLGPMAIAEGLVREAENGQMVPGEPAFLMAELALTLSRVEWDRTATLVGIKPVHQRLRGVLRKLRKRGREISSGPRLQEYVDEAFRKARL